MVFIDFWLIIEKSYLTISKNLTYQKYIFLNDYLTKVILFWKDMIFNNDMMFCRGVEDLNESSDEGISDISTQETIINPSHGNNK